MRSISQAEKDRLQKEEKLQNSRACHDKDVLPSGGFCLDLNNSIKGRNVVWDDGLCVGLEKIFGESSVADFGAGVGWYGACLLRLGRSMITTTNEAHRRVLQKVYDDKMMAAKLKDKKQVVRSYEAFDGALNVEEMTNGMIKHADLTLPLELNQKFDWVLSLEVAEHIAKENEEVFINNLVTHACKGIVLSWAILGQPGHYHVNNQNNDYVVARMQEKGLLEDREASTYLRGIVKTLPYFRRTIMVFRFPKPTC